MIQIMTQIFALLFISYACFDFATACTSFAIGRKATADGSVIVAQSEDGDDLADPRVIFVPARDYPPNAMAPVYYTDGPAPRWVSDDLGPGYEPNEVTGPNITAPIGYIPQVSHTYAYWDSNFAIINEYNVGIGETTCSAMFYTCGKGDTRHCEPGRKVGEALLDIRMLTMFGLERAKTAREAIKIMGELAYEYGFYGTHDPNGDGESLMVGDSEEAWVFHILADPTGTKAIWAAKRVPDDSMTVASNMFTIRDIDVTDAENCMASPNVYSVAESHGWWSPGTPLDFTKVYSNGEYGSKYYSGRRMWRALNLAAPSLKLPADYNDLRYDRMWPWATKPDKLLTHENVFSWYRDWYAGTKFDMTKGLAAGFAGTPDRFDAGSDVTGAWERSIALYRTNLIKVVQLQKVTKDRPRQVAGIAWLAPGPAHYSPFLPVPSGLTVDLPPLTKVTPKRFSKNAFNWESRKVMMTAQIRFDYMHPLVEKRQRAMEKAGQELISKLKIEEHGWDEKVVAHVNAALSAWQHLSEEMLVHFSDNSDITRISTKPDSIGLSENTASLGYPSWWLRAVGFTNWSPPPAENQCPPLCSSPSELSNRGAIVQHFSLYSMGGLMTMLSFSVFACARHCWKSGDAKDGLPYMSL